MAYAGAHVSKWQNVVFSSPLSSPEFVTSLHTGDACEEDAGCLANLSGNAQHHYRARAHRPRLSGSIPYSGYISPDAT